MGNFAPKRHFLRHFLFCYCACTETAKTLLPVSKWTSNSDLSCRKTHVGPNGEFCKKTAFLRHFCDFVTAHAPKQDNTTSGFKMDLKFRFLMAKKLCNVEFCPKTAFLRRASRSRDIRPRHSDLFTTLRIYANWSAGKNNYRMSYKPRQ